MATKQINTIKYSLAMLANPQHEGDPKKAYAFIQLNSTVTMDQLVAHMAAHNTIYTRGVITGVLTDLGGCIRELVAQGFKVQLADLGHFVPAINSTGANSMEEFTVDNIRSLRVRFEAGEDFEDIKAEADFEYVPTRAAQDALKAAQKAGETNVDITPKRKGDSDGGNENPEP